MPDRRSLLLALPALALADVSKAQAPTGRAATPAAAPDLSRGARLEQVATFPDRQVTGITVSRTGRVFVCLPRWTVDVPVSVAELRDGELRPYPDAAWNAYRNTDPTMPERRFVCVQSVVVDPADNLWVLDPAAPGQQGPVRNGPKMVRVDLRTNEVAQVIAIPPTVAPPGSYLNDVRFSPDGRWAYATDSGTPGGIAVVDLRAGRARRVLHDHPSVRFEEGVIPTVDGAPLRRPDGRPPQFAADGIALSPDGATLYWQALTGKSLYAVPTAVLRDLNAPAARIGAAVRKVGETHPADGFWMDVAGRLYVTNFETDAVEVAERLGAALQVLVRDERLRWPDTLSQGPDGALYVTASHIQDSPWFKPDARVTPSSVWRIVPA